MEQKQRTSNVTTKVSFSIIAISLPLIYVSFLHIPLSSLSKDTIFWFLISNSIIFIVASIDSSKFTKEHDMYDEYVKYSKINHASARNCEYVHDDNLPNDRESPPFEIRSNSKRLEEANEEITKHEVPHMNVHENINKNKEEKDLLGMVVEEEDAKERKEEQVVVGGVKEESSKCGRSKSELGKRREGRRCSTSPSRTCVMEENEYMKMSNEELNTRVEEFIRRFNREIRLQERMIQTSVC